MGNCIEWNTILNYNNPGNTFGALLGEAFQVKTIAYLNSKHSCKPALASIYS